MTTMMKEFLQQILQMKKVLKLKKQISSLKRQCL